MKIFTKSALTLAAAACLCSGAHAQYQLPNAGFEGEWQMGQTKGTCGYTSDLASGWNSFVSAQTNSTTDMAFGALGGIIPPQAGTSWRAGGHSGEYGMLIISKQNMLGSISNGNLTTGRINMGTTQADGAENYNFSDVEDEQYSQTFAGLPDSLVVWVKFLPQNTADSASVHGILHKEYNYKEPHATAEEQAQYRIGRAYSVITYKGREWQRVSVPYEYDAANLAYDGQKYLLLSLTTNKNPGGGSDADSLFVDDVQMVYNSALAYVQVGEKRYEVPAGAAEISIAEPYAEGVQFVANGVSATVEAAAVDGGSDAWAVAVKGGDYAENPENVTNYTVRFGAASGITDVNAAPASGIVLRNTDGGLEIEASRTAAISIYRIDGTLVGQYTVQQGVQIVALPAGCYIVAGQKVVVW